MYPIFTTLNFDTTPHKGEHCVYTCMLTLHMYNLEHKYLCHELHMYDSPSGILSLIVVSCLLIVSDGLFEGHRVKSLVVYNPLGYDVILYHHTGDIVSNLIGH